MDNLERRNNMKNGKQISVIIPFYNIGEYVLKTIESLKSQTYKNFEVIFINNCSTDNSLEIIKEQLKTVAFSYKIINRTRNEGPSSARNIGIDNANGDYVFFLDADDYIRSETFEKVIDVFEKENSDMAFFQFVRVDEKGNVVEPYKKLYKDVNKIETSRDILIKYLNLEVFLYTCSVVYKKQSIKNLYFNNINFIEDQDFVIRALLVVEKVGYIDSELVHYVQRKGSLMHNKQGEFELKKLDKIKLFDIFYSQYKSKDEELAKLFSQRRAKEVLWITRAYVKSETNLKFREMKNYIRSNILTDEIISHLDIEHLKNLNIKNIIQIFMLKYFPSLFISLSRNETQYFNFRSRNIRNISILSSERKEDRVSDL